MVGKTYPRGATPEEEGGGRFVLNDKDNGALDDRGCRRRDARLSSLLCAVAAGMWRASSSSDYEDTVNGRDYGKDTAWEPA